MRLLTSYVVGLLVGTATLTAGVLPAQAQTVTVSYARTFNTSTNRGFTYFDPSFQNGTPGPGNPNGNAVYRFIDAYIGPQTLTLTGAVNTTQRGYCVDILGVLGTVGGQPVPFNALVRPTSAINTGNPNVSTAIRGGGVAWLFLNTNITANALDQGITGLIDTAALQLVVWESLYDWNGSAFNTLTAGNVNLDAFSGGNFQYLGTPVVGYGNPFTDPDGIGANDIDAAVSSAIRGRANDFLLAWGGQTSTGGTYLDTSDVTGTNQPPAGRTRQDLITVAVTAAPEPATVLLGLLGLIGLAGLARRRQ